VVSTLGDLVRADGPPGVELWLHPDLCDAWADGLPVEGAAGVSVASRAGGRGRVLRAALPGGAALVRTYRRGGALAGLLPDRFVLAGRARREVEALARLRGAGIAPDVLGLEARGPWLKRLRIAVREVPGALDLVRWIGADARRADDVVVARAMGAAVARMHAAGVAHADLHVGNVLVDPAAPTRVTLVDFDAARLFAGPVPERRRCADVLRLCRSVDKWDATARSTARARAAFLRACFPAAQALGVLLRARRAHGLRAVLGRTARPRA
jgi:3-deoxy-D-manno-octulosonic acid kinase